MKLMSGPVKLSAPATHEFWEIPVVYEDAHLLALDKPAGLAVAPDADDSERPNLLSLLHQAIAAQKPWVRERGLSFLNSPQRLDTDSSGVLVFAREKATQLKLADWFGAGKPGRGYAALVVGAPADDRFEIEARLTPHPVRHGLMVVSSRRGKPARTVVEVVERFQGYALVHCDALMDRRHQVRAHLRHMQLPVVGDRLYGGKPLLLSQLKSDYRLKPDRMERPLLARPALHAHRVTLPHPISGEAITIEAELPKDMQVALKYLRRFGA